MHHRHMVELPGAVVSDDPARSREYSVSPPSASLRPSFVPSRSEFDDLPPLPPTPICVEEHGLGTLQLETQAALVRAHQFETMRSDIKEELQALQKQQSSVLRALQQRSVPLSPDTRDKSLRQSIHDISMHHNQLEESLSKRIEDAQAAQQQSLKTVTEALKKEMRDSMNERAQPLEDTVREMQAAIKGLSAQVMALQRENTALREHISDIEARPPAPTTPTPQLLISEATPGENVLSSVLAVSEQTASTRSRSRSPLRTEHGSDDEFHWEEVRNGTNTFYYNKRTKCKQWEKPEAAHPTYWEEMKASDGSLFFYCRATHTKRWSLPLNGIVADGKDGIHSNPTTWEQFKSDSGKTFYRNKLSHKKQWDPPICLSPSV
eukprot:TRINITY_DN10724_c0_g1_i3.p1 TRINITY_DN10724_c0_g1~~TRINITY_DN10724_c0_g1_i3.p1  ORF type:complete len:378 (+),score=64.86 TRINITY_DN10724_c0_g1_i3:70-1203(+)